MVSCDEISFKESISMILFNWDTSNFYKKIYKWIIDKSDKERIAYYCGNIPTFIKWKIYLYLSA